MIWNCRRTAMRSAAIHSLTAMGSSELARSLPALSHRGLGPEGAMLRTGAILLSLWTGFNLILALGILFMLLALGKNPPCLLILYGDTSAVGMDARALATINALAVVFNGCAAAICALSLAVIWVPLIRGAVWAFWALAGSLCFLQAAGFASDSFFAHKNLVPNLVSTGLLLIGFAAAAGGIFGDRRGSPNQARGPTSTHHQPTVTPADEDDALPF